MTISCELPFDSHLTLTGEHQLQDVGKVANNVEHCLSS